MSSLGYDLDENFWFFIVFAMQEAKIKNKEEFKATKMQKLCIFVLFKFLAVNEMGF